MEGDYQPMWVGEFDVGFPPADLKVPVGPDGRPYRRGRILIRFCGEPVGMVTVPLDEQQADREALTTVAWERFGPEIAALAPPGWSPGDPGMVMSPQLAAVLEGDLPAVSLVIGTRNRPDQVIECTEVLLGLRYPAPIEVIIVDNGASDGATADIVSDTFGTDERVRYIAETKPGLSRARNLGLAAARYPITAFLSDDIRVDELWLLAIVRGFQRDARVQCVTGFCPPMYLDTAEQLLFESSMAWGTRQGFSPVLHHFDSAVDPLHPYRPGSFANGSNMAYDTEAFRHHGGFDESLGPGTIAKGGEDLDAPIRLLAHDGLVAYEPAAIGWHADRYDDRAFTQHMYTYGLGLTAFLTKHVLDPRYRKHVLGRVPQGLPVLAKGFDGRDRELLDSRSLPMKYYFWHLFGRMAGPFAYLRSRRSRR